MAGESCDDAGFSQQADLRREQLQIIDRLDREIRNSTNHMMDVNDKFWFLTNVGFLTNMKRVCDVTSIVTTDRHESRLETRMRSISLNGR